MVLMMSMSGSVELYFPRLFSPLERTMQKGDFMIDLVAEITCSSSVIDKPYQQLFTDRLPKGESFLP